MPFSCPPITRRSILAWGGAGTLGLAIGIGTGEPSLAATAQQLTVAGSASTYTTFSEDFRQRFANALPNTLELASPVPLGGGTIQVDFDPRMLGLSDGAAQLVLDTGVEPATMSVEDGSVLILIPKDVRATHAVVGLPFFASVRYPSENVGQSAVPTAHVTVGERSADSAFPIDGTTTQGLAWGGELDVAWRRLPVDANADYFVPALLTLTSVGPGPVPSGTRIRVRTDSVLTSEVGPRPAPLAVPDTGAPAGEPDPSAASPETTVTGTHGDGARSVDIVLENDLTPGTTFTTALSGGNNGARIRVKAVTFAQVTMEPPEVARDTQRVTGAETVTPLAPGGLPLAPGILMGSI